MNIVEVQGSAGQGHINIYKILKSSTYMNG